MIEARAEAGAFWRLHGLPLLAFALLALVFTFPAAIRLTSHALGTGDVFVFVWELWWFHHALFELHQSPLATDLLFYPTGMPLIWSTPLMLLLGVPLVGWLGPVLTYNVLMLAALAVAGFGGYLLAWHFLGRRDVALLAGVVFAFAPAHMGHLAMGQLGMATVAAVPFVPLALFRLYESPSWRRAGLLTLALAAVALTDLYVAVYFLGSFLGVFALYHLLTDRARLLRPGFLVKAAAGGAAAVALAAPFYLPTLAALQGAATTTAIAATVHRYGQDLLQLVLPPDIHLAMGFLSRPWSAHFTNRDNWAFLGFIPILTAAVALWRVRQPAVRFWGLYAGLTLLFALGTTLHVAGPTGLPLPYMLATKLPLLQNFRAPGRLAIFAMLGLGVLAAFGAAWLLRSWHGRRRRLAVAALVTFVCFEFMAFAPFPTRTAAVPEFYRQLAQDPTAGAVLALPTGDPSWGGFDHQWMYYQTVHRRPLVHAHTHRVPDGALDFTRKTPLLRDLTNLAYTGGVLKTPAGDRAGARDRFAAAGITHVTLHAWPGQLEGTRYVRLKHELAAIFGPPLLEAEDMVVFRLGEASQPRDIRGMR